MASGDTGNGPRCPIDPSHGKTYDWRDKGGRSGRDFWCGHSAHGGNGKFFTDKEAHGDYELNEDDVTSIYEAIAHEVIAGRTTLDAAVAATAKKINLPTSQVREALVLMVDTIEEKDEKMATAKKTTAAKKAAPKAAGTRRTLEHTDGAEFARIRDELGLTNKQAAEATGEAGMGASPTYIYIVTHQGSSTQLFEKFEAALRAYAKKNKIKPGAAKAVAEAKPAKALKVAKAAAPAAEAKAVAPAKAAKTNGKAAAVAVPKAPARASKKVVAATPPA